MEYQTNDRVYFVRSHRIVTKASVLGRSYEFYIIRFVGNTGVAALEKNGFRYAVSEAVVDAWRRNAVLGKN